MVHSIIENHLRFRICLNVVLHSWNVNKFGWEKWDINWSSLEYKWRHNNDDIKIKISVSIHNCIAYETYISDFWFLKICRNGTVLQLIYGATLVLTAISIFCCSSSESMMLASSSVLLCPVSSWPVNKRWQPMKEIIKIGYILVFWKRSNNSPMTADIAAELDREVQSGTLQRPKGWNQKFCNFKDGGGRHF